VLKKLFFSILLLSSLIYAAEIQQPKFKLSTIDGKTIEVQGKQGGIDIPQFKGKVILVEFWGTHCPPCRMSIPHYINLTKKYKDKMAMLAVEVQMTPKDRLLAFAKAKGINYNLLTQSENMNFVRYLAQRAGWRGAIPYLMVFDTKGEILAIKRGMVSENYVDQVIQYALNKAKLKESKTEDNTTKSNDKNSSIKASTKRENNASENNTTK